MSHKYPDIESSKRRKVKTIKELGYSIVNYTPFIFKSLLLDFTHKESDKIIIDLVQKITDHEKNREIFVKFDRLEKDKDRIYRAMVSSKDSILDGLIVYIEPDMGEDPVPPSNARIFASIKFKSDNTNDHEEYEGLVKTIRHAGFL